MTKIAGTLLICLSGLVIYATARADTALEISMKHISKAYKQLILDLKQPDDANKADYLALAGTMKSEVKTARGLVPKKAAALPPDQQALMVKNYQKSMDDLALSIDTLTQDIQNSQWDAANKQIATIKQQEDDGHKAFRKKEN